MDLTGSMNCEFTVKLETVDCNYFIVSVNFNDFLNKLYVFAHSGERGR